MLPKAPQLPGNWHFKPSAAKTCSHNMFMKCQMLQNDILTVPCQDTPPFLTLCQYYFFPTSTFSNIHFSSNSQSPCPATTLLPLQQGSPLPMSSFSNAALIQPSPPHTPFRPQSLSTPSFLAYWLSES